MATKIPEAEARMFKNVFVCRDCKTKMKTTSMRVLSGSVKCRKCGSRHLRPVRKK
jgi:ribosomal protein L40E